MTTKIIRVSFDRTYFSRDFDEDKFKKEQELYAQMIKFDENFKEENIKLIGGLDISGSSKEDNFFVVCLIVFDYITKQILAQFSMECEIKVPYKAEFLGYKEVPAFFELIKNVKKYHKSFLPDIILIDGNGFWHSRSCGSATHFSVLSGIPSIGISKSYLQIDGLSSKEEMEKMIFENLKNVGDTLKIKREGADDYVGAIYMATESVKKCLYISVGNGLTLDLAINIVKRFMIFRNNEIIRQADLISRDLIREHEKIFF
jgi:deoxyinosine 3'endonuclease (endonuclease V)